MKNCPYCSEEIQDSAKKCRFCGEFLPEASSDIPEKTPTKVHSPKNIENNWQKTFYWTLAIGIAIILSGFASLQKGGDMSGIFIGPGVVIASLGYIGIQKRREGKQIYTLLEVIAGMTLGFFALLSDPRELFKEPIVLLGLALFLSYYAYPVIDTKVLNKWGRIILRVVSVGVILFVTSMSILSWKSGPVSNSHSMQKQTNQYKDQAQMFAEMDKALESSGKR